MRDQNLAGADANEIPHISVKAQVLQLHLHHTLSEIVDYYIGKKHTEAAREKKSKTKLTRLRALRDGTLFDFLDKPFEGQPLRNTHVALEWTKQSETTFLSICLK